MRDEFQVRTFLEAFGCIDIEPEDYKGAFPTSSDIETKVVEGDASMLDPENLIAQP